MTDAAKLAAFEALLTEVGQSLVEIADQLRKRNDDTVAAEIATGVCELASAIERRKDVDLREVVSALQALRNVKPPHVTVQVSPTPVKVEVAAPVVIDKTVTIYQPAPSEKKQAPIALDVEGFEYDSKNRITKFRVTPVKGG